MQLTYKHISSVNIILGGGGGGGGSKGRLTELDLSIHTQQDVVALDVTMDHLIGVKELQRLQTLGRHKKKKKMFNIKQLSPCLFLLQPIVKFHTCTYTHYGTTAFRKMHVHIYPKDLLGSSRYESFTILHTYLSTHCCNLTLIHASLCDYICERTSSKILHHNLERERERERERSKHAQPHSIAALTHP